MIPRSSPRPSARGSARARRVFGALLVTVTVSGLGIVSTSAANAQNSVGTVRTVAGVFARPGTSFAGDGGPATQAVLGGPRAFVLDGHGGVYIADDGNDVIRFVDPSGVIHTVAGRPFSGASGAGSPPAGSVNPGCDVPAGGSASSGENIPDTAKYGDGGPPTAALLCRPSGVALDSRGDLYISDTFDNVIRKVTHPGQPGAVITTVAGTGNPTGNVSGAAPAATASLDLPGPLAVGPADELYVSDTAHTQVKVIDVSSPQPTVTTVAGQENGWSFNGDGQAVSHGLGEPEGLWVSPDGTTLYVAGYYQNLVRKVTLHPSDASLNQMTTVAGNPAAACAGTTVTGPAGDGGPALGATLDQPAGVAVDPATGVLFIGEDHGGDVRRVDLKTGVITRYAGDGKPAGQSGSVAGDPGPGPASTAEFSWIAEVKIDPATGDLWVADSGDNIVRAITYPPGWSPGTSPSPTPPASTTTPCSTPSTPAPPGQGANPPSSPGNGQPPAGAARYGYWMLESGGTVHGFGDAAPLPGTPTAGTTNAVHIEATPSGDGYWVIDSAGRVSHFGDATDYGSVNRAALASGETVTSLSSTSDGRGYWVFTSRGRVITFGDATPYGDVSTLHLNGPVLGSIVTPDGRGYWMVASDGGIFSEGDAIFYGSMGAAHLNKPVEALVPTASGNGYWLVASDGGVFAFGDAHFAGSMGATKLNRPISGMVRSGNGYLMVGADGGIFDFSGTPYGYQGSLGANPPATPITSVALLDH